jgi:hypothetical protein
VKIADFIRSLVAEPLEHLSGRLQRGQRVPQRQAHQRHLVRAALSQRLSEGRGTGKPNLI